MHHRFSNQRGQVAVLFALLFPMFVLLLAFFVNMGLLINQKIRLQNSVDAGVYSANASLAADLNKIARLNREIRNTFKGKPNENKYCRQWRDDRNYLEWTKKHNFNDEFLARAKFYEYQNAYHYCLDKIDRISNSAVENAIENGERAAKRTFYNGDASLISRNPNKLSFEIFGMKKTDPLIGYTHNTFSTTSCYEKVSDAGGNPFDPYEGYACDFTKEANVTIRKTNKVKFGAELKANVGFTNIWEDRFRVAPGHYDSATRQIKLKVAAAGQPYDGSVEGLQDTYRATLIPVKKVDGGRDELH